MALINDLLQPNTKPLLMEFNSASPGGGVGLKTPANLYANSGVTTEFQDTLAVPKADISTYDPSLGTVNLDTDTVSGQLKNILGKDNPYITRARASAAEASNARGLINTTMGAQAGEAAAIDAALPIATSDAGIFGEQRLANQASSNKASEFNAGEKNRFGLIGAQSAADLEAQKQKQAGDIALQTLQGEQSSTLQSEKSEQDKERQTQAETAASNLATLNNNATSELNITLQNMRNTGAFDLAALDASVKAATSSGANVTSLLNQASADIVKINALPNLTDEQRQTMIDDVQTSLTNGLATLTAAYTVPLGDYLQFGGPSAATPVPAGTATTPTNADLNLKLTQFVTDNTRAGTLSKEAVQDYMLENKITQPMVEAAYPDPVAYNMIADYMGWTRKPVPGTTTTTTPTTTTSPTTTTTPTPTAPTPATATQPSGLTPTTPAADVVANNKASFTDYVTQQNAAGTLDPLEVKRWLAFNNLGPNEVRAAYPDDEAYNIIADYIGWPRV